MSNYPRARFGMAIAVAFICGLVFASGFDLTRFGWAQTRLASGPSVPATAVAPLAETQTAFETIVDRVKPAVVSIHVAKYAQPASQQKKGAGRQGQGLSPQDLDELLRRQFGGGAEGDPENIPRQGSGSGFIVSKDGYILTNNHVVAGMDRVQVILVDKRSFTAKVVGTDPTTDVALIKIDGDNFPTVPLGDDATARVGQWVLAVGNPLELDFTVTAGIISAKGRNIKDLPRTTSYSITDFIQTDAAINPGNSGGPLVNIRGEVIGINSAIASGTGYYAGYGFAIPIGLVKVVMNDLMKYGSVRRGVVGVSLQEVTPEDAQAAGLKEIAGAKVSDFTEGSSAKAAGIELGDVIVAADGKPVDQVSTLQRIIRGFSIGQSVKIDLMRFGQAKQVSVKLTDVKPEAPVQVASNETSSDLGNAPTDHVTTKAFDKLGLSVSTMPGSIAAQRGLPETAKNGLLITNVAARSDAADKLVNKGYDIIEEVLYPKRRDVKTLADLESAVSGLKSGDVITLRMYTRPAPEQNFPGGNRVVSLRIQ